MIDFIFDYIVALEVITLLLVVSIIFMSNFGV